MYPYIHIGHLLTIPTYYLIISIGTVLSLMWLFRRLDPKEEHLAHKPLMLAMVAGFLGARALHVVYEAPQYYWNHPLQVLAIWNGGFVFYGGLIAGLLTFYIIARRQDLPVKKWFDAAAPCLSLGYMIGRVGCFFNGCCYGKVSALPWAVIFAGQHLSRQPTQAYAVIWEALLIVALLWLEKKKTFYPGQFFAIWLMGHSVGRILMEIFRDDDRGALILGLSISTWISIALFISAVRIWEVSQTRLSASSSTVEN